MKLKKMKVTAVALVDRGANRKEFFLIKKHKGVPMKKETAILLLKSGSDLTEEQKNEIVNSVADADKAEVKEIAKATELLDGEEESAENLSKTVKELNKATEDQLKTIAETIVAVKEVLENLVESLKVNEAAEDTDTAALDKKDGEEEMTEEEMEAELNKQLSQILEN